MPEPGNGMPVPSLEVAPSSLAYLRALIVFVRSGLSRTADNTSVGTV